MPSPIAATNVAELHTTSAGDMVAAGLLEHNVLAFRTAHHLHLPNHLVGFLVAHLSHLLPLSVVFARAPSMGSITSFYACFEVAHRAFDEPFVIRIARYHTWTFFDVTHDFWWAKPSS